MLPGPSIRPDPPYVSVSLPFNGDLDDGVVIGVPLFVSLFLDFYHPQYPSPDCLVLLALTFVNGTVLDVVQLNCV